MRIAITGSTGMIGSQLIAHLASQGHDIVQITRRSTVNNFKTPIIHWDPAQGQLNSSDLEGFDVVIHLAGASVGERWNKEYKELIFNSRVESTRLLSQTLAKLTRKPKLLISASAIGYYGNHAADVVLDEKSPKGTGFLPDVCQHWEAETQPAKDAGIRVVLTRIGVVLSKKGGALTKMWMPFQMGVGGVLGKGQQMMSWISLNEIPFIIDHVIKNDINGPVNCVAPDAVSNKVFTKVLGKVIKRPTIFPVPSFMIQLLFGEMGKELLLEGSNVKPLVLANTGYSFRYPNLQSALEEAVR